jgi:DNA-directed RNA polymerase subunit RPC12/RpoP
VQVSEPSEKVGAAERPASYGVEAEIERLMCCPECGSSRVRQVREGIGGGYGIMGFKAIAEFGATKHVRCRNCGHQWERPPLRELRREAERRVDERYAALDVENERLRRQLADYLAYQRDIDRGMIPPPERELQEPGDRRNSLTPGSPQAGN